MAEFSTTKITPSDGVQIPSINGQVAGYQENDELKSYVLGTIPTDVSGHTADITGIRGTSLDYDPDSTTYTKGATCILNHIVYRAKQLIPSPAGAFDSSKWEEVSLHEIARKVATNTDAITSLKAITRPTVTYITSAVGWNYQAVTVKGGWCHIVGRITPNQDIGGYVNLITGLPLPAQDFYFTVEGSGTYRALLYMGADGILQGQSFVNQIQYFLNIVYPIAES